MVRLLFGKKAEVTLEITADPAANPHLKDVSNPAELLGRSLSVHLPSGKSWTLAEIGTPTVTLRDGFPFPAPIPVQHPADEPLPELYTASWTWRPSESPIHFEIPAKSPQTVVFWSVLPDSDAVAPNWRMLMAGDRTPPQVLPMPPAPLQWSWKAALALGVAGLGLVGQAILLVHKIRTKRLR
jgi:hypothetical protein